MTQMLHQDIEYVDVRPSSGHHHEPTTFYEEWVDQFSAKLANPELIGAAALRRLYPGHSLVISEDHRLNLLEFPGATVDVDEQEQGRVTSVAFRPIPRRVEGKAAGSLVDNLLFGSYKVTWNVGVLVYSLEVADGIEQKSKFIVHIATFQQGVCTKTAHFILHDGPEKPARDLVLAACIYAEQDNDEIWVFNRGNWFKSKSLWLEVKNSSWDDVVIKEENKKALKKDIYGFFGSEMTYKKLSIPWTRGLILHGPPGNGKTMSIRAIVRTCSERGFTPLYVKSFQNFSTDEVSMQLVFQKARELAPCVLILEDLDSLINDTNRSFFLNQLDGLEGNDGLLVIASTNHLDKLDPSLSSRPSRFDRKYLFDDPDHQERVLYTKFWQEKLKDNDEISFPASLVEAVVEMTQGFSFAYLKEAFVSALVQTTGVDDDERVAFPDVLKDQITTLRKELGKQSPVRIIPYLPTPKIRLGKALDEQVRVPSTAHQSTTSPEDTLPHKSRGPRQLPLPTRVNVSPSEPDASDDSFSLPVSPNQHLHIYKKRLDNPPRPWPSEKVYGSTSTAPSGRSYPPGSVLHAPSSAYPQVMPGSLPSAGPISRTSSTDASRRNLMATDSAPSFEMYDAHMKGRSASADRDN